MALRNSELRGSFCWHGRASLRQRVVEPEPLAEAWDALRVHLEGVTAAEVGEAREIGAAFGGVNLGQFAEEVLEARGRDDLDDLARRVAGVPERVPLVARFEH